MPKDMGRVPFVEIFVHSNAGHLQQLYTGFRCLHAAGEIKAVQRLRGRPAPRDLVEPHLRDARLAHCSVIVNQKIRLYYDMHDSWEVDDEALKYHDIYFKRSFYPDRLSKQFDDYHKIRPYGLNYEVVANPVDLFALQRSVLSRNARELLTSVGWSTGLADLWQFIPTMKRMEMSPPINESGNIIFMARTWDPDEDMEYIDTARRADRDKINRMRAECIRALKRRFGDKFFGGFAPTKHAIKAYPDLVLNGNSAKKRNYINLLRGSSIAVASAGLHGSIGWKMAEYVAFSRAIVSEKIESELPGGFSDGVNYLSFQSADECVEMVDRLRRDDAFRRRMMINNRSYYENMLNPKSIVARTLSECLLAPTPI